MAENKSGSFEASLDRLTAIVKELEGEGVNLERSVELFREGRTLVTHCETLLKNAEATLRSTEATTAAPVTLEREPEDEQPF
jgi:exodeoxyribonuclease VII small subunit